MSRLFKIAAAVGIGIVLIFLVTLSVLYHLIQSGELRAYAISEIEKQTGAQVKVGETNLSLGRVIGISFADFVLLDPETAEPVMTAEKVIARVALLPLWRKQAVISELRVSRPTLQIHRDQQGKIPQLDLLMALLFREQEKLRFSLDLRKIGIEEGEIRFVDVYKSRGPVVTEFHSMRLDLRRLSRILGGSPGAPPPSDQENPGGDVEFSLSTVVQKGERTSGLKSRGKVVFPAASFDLREAWFDAEAQIDGFPTGGILDYTRPPAAIKALHGTLGGRLTWQGRLSERVVVKGQATFHKLAVEAPDWFAAAVSPGDGRVEFSLDRTPRELRVSRLVLSSKETVLTLQGRGRSLDQEDPFLEIQVVTPFVPIAAARPYIPVKVLSSPKLAALIGAVHQGEVKVAKAGISGPWSRIRRFSERGFEHHVWLDAELRGVAAEARGERYLPLSNVGGRLILDKGILYYKGFKGQYGLSQFTDVEGTHKGILSDQAALELRALGDVDLAQLRDQLRLSFPSPSMDKGAGKLQELSGRGRVGLLLQTDGVSHRYEGRLALENASARAGDLLLSQIKGEASFSNTEIRTERMSALLAGSPLTVRLFLKNYLTDGSTFDLSLDSPGIKAAALSPILPSVASSQDAGIVRGAIRYQGPLAMATGRELTGSVELIGVQLQRGVFGRPMHDLSGRIKLDKTVIDFQPVKGRISGYSFDLTGQWRHAEKPQLTFSLVSPEMDLDSVLPKGEATPSEWYDRLQAKGKVNIVKGRHEGFEFSALKTDLTIDKRQWRLENFSARSHGGIVEGSALFLDLPVGISFSLQPKVQAVPIEGFLKWFDSGTAEITGQVNLTGTFDSTGKNRAEKKRNLNGAFHLRLEDGVVRRLTVLVRILNLLDLSRWFSLKMPDLNQQGIRFRSVTGDFKIERGVYTTQNLFVDSDDLRLTGAGTLDGNTDEVNFVVAVRPFPRLDTAINFIPLIGPGVAAIKNSLLVASFRVRGPIDDPTITPAPLSTLSEFFFSALAIPKGIIRGAAPETK